MLMSWWYREFLGTILFCETLLELAGPLEVLDKPLTVLLYAHTCATSLISCHISSLTQNLCWTHTLYLAYSEQDLSPETGKMFFSTGSHRNQTTRIYLQQRSKLQCTCIETTTCVSFSLPNTHICACTDTQCPCLCTEFLQPGLLLTEGEVEGQFCHPTSIATLGGVLNQSLPPSACLIPSCYSNRGYW